MSKVVLSITFAFLIGWCGVLHFALTRSENNNLMLKERLKKTEEDLVKATKLTVLNMLYLRAFSTKDLQAKRPSTHRRLRSIKE